MSDRSQVKLWFGLSLLLPIYFGSVSLVRSISYPYAVQDDVRQHVVWFEQFIDPQLFPNDWIAGYFRSISPVGFEAFYYLFAKLGIEPLLLAKILPLVLSAIAGAYCFGIALELLKIPAGAFLTSVILMQSLWLEDDIVTATPRSFVYPIFLAFLYYLLKRKPLFCAGAIALQSVFYPQLALVEVGILTVRLLNWQGRITLSRNRKDYFWWLVSAAIALFLLLAFRPSLGAYAPPVSLAEMRVMPEFGVDGRAQFFNPNPFEFWLTGNSGLALSADPPLIWLSLLLPIFCWRKQFGIEKIAQLRLLLDILLASLGWFLLAHLLLPKLYVPARYTQHSLRVLMAIAAGIVLTLLLDYGLRFLPSSPNPFSLGRRGAEPDLSPSPSGRGARGEGNTQRSIALQLSGILLAVLLIVPQIPSVFIRENAQLIGSVPDLYEFFAQQPKDILIASLSEEINSVPTFSKRSILVGREYVLPYHMGYYREMRQRAIDLLTAQYSSDLQIVKNFIQKYGIDFFVLDRDAFEVDYIDDSDWLEQFETVANEAIDRLERGEHLILQRSMRRCAALRLRQLVVLKANCVAGS